MLGFKFKWACVPVWQKVWGSSLCSPKGTRCLRAKPRRTLCEGANGRKVLKGTGVILRWFLKGLGEVCKGV